MSEVEVFDALKYRVEVDGYGNRFYYNSNGEFHRIDGPAVEWGNGTKRWFQNGLRHRTDGPAVVYSDGSMEWYINGKILTEAEFKEAVKAL